MKTLLLALLLLALPVWGQTPHPEQSPGLSPSPAAGVEPNKEVHDQLRAMKDDCVSALNSGDFDAVLKLTDDQIVFTAMDARLAHGKEELRAYFDAMLKGPDRVVESFSTAVTVDRLTTLYGTDFGVATGTSLSSYKLTDGTAFEIENRWTASVVRRGGQWLLGSFHSSANVFDNPLLSITKKTANMAAVGVAIAFLLLGLGLGRMSKRTSG